MMDAWAIKHLPSGRYLPAPRGRGGRGGTHVEIDDPGMPRLFPSEASARAALRWWLGGTVHVGQHTTFNGWVEDTDEDWTIKPTPHRKAEDMNVVRVRLTEPGASHD